MHIVIIGAGAAGCFAAIVLKQRCPEADITLLERGTRPLAKVSVTGGGRCNLTNSFKQVRSLEQVYPRGHRLIKKLFHQFSPQDTCDWFEREGVRLVVQPDECIFPRSQKAMEIVNTLLRKMERWEIRLFTRSRVQSIEPLQNGYIVYTAEDSYKADKVLVTTGGYSKSADGSFINGLQLKTFAPVPSLFSFALDSHALSELMGLVIDETVVTLSGTKFQANGPLLITHWGVSGPAVLRLSSYAARHLAENQYKDTLCIRWTGTRAHNDIEGTLYETATKHKHKLISGIHLFGLQARLWTHLLKRAGLHEGMRWADLQGKAFHKLVNTLTNDSYAIIGKNRFKEEFVTCGGIALDELNASTLESKRYPGLYFAGEVTDIDAVTGGFNLQAAWTMGYVAAHAISESIK